MQTWAERQAEIDRQMEEAGELTLPDTTRLVDQFLENVRHPNGSRR